MSLASIRNLCYLGVAGGYLAGSDGKVSLPATPRVCPPHVSKWYYKIGTDASEKFSTAKCESEHFTLA